MGNKIIIFAVVVLILGGSLAYFAVTDDNVLPYTPQELSQRTIYIGGAPVKVEVADTQQEQSQGLGGRESLAPGHGMLFVFREDAKYGIWMENMQFPIDIIWIREDGVVVDIAERVAPETYPETFSPAEPVRYVLETRADFVSLHNIEVGDKVEL